MKCTHDTEGVTQYTRNVHSIRGNVNSKQEMYITYKKNNVPKITEGGVHITQEMVYK